MITIAAPEKATSEFRLAENLRLLLAHRDWSVSQLHRKTGVPISTIHTWTQGRIPKNLISVQKVARAFAITIDRMCFDQNPIAIPPEFLGSSRSPNEQLFVEFIDFLKARGRI